MSKKYIVHDRVGPQGSEIPIDPESIIDIPEELYGILENIQEAVERLNNSRYELGRLEQVKSHLLYTCNTAENLSAEEKKKLLNNLGLNDIGNYAIDFETKTIGRVMSIDGAPAPKVVGG